jgi:hypothetical protein
MDYIQLGGPRRWWGPNPRTASSLIMPLSSNTLFHFTSNIDHLISILVNEFRPRYCLEDYAPLWMTPPEVAIPTICFCDIPLSQTIEHMRKYGSYAIGLSKVWGLRHGITPVHYIPAKSPAATALAALRENRPPANEDELVGTLLRLYMLFKPYEGVFKRRGLRSRKVRFYDEREWRWLPPDLVNARMLQKDEYDDAAVLEQANNDVWQNARLPFGPDDIKYIVVADESERYPMIRALQKIKRKYEPEVILRVSSRILTAQQVREDF